jgi:hypothetical protein
MKGWNIFGWKKCKCVRKGTPGRFFSRPTFDGFYSETECRLCRGTGLRPLDENGRAVG